MYRAIWPSFSAPHSTQHWRGLSLLLACLLVLLPGCGSVETRSHKVEGVELSRYHTFRFTEASQASDERFFTPTNQVRIRVAIQAGLEQGGLRLSEPADLEFSVYLSTTTRIYNKTKPSVGSGSMRSDLRTYYGVLYDKSLGPQTTVTYPEGTLVVQATDVRQNRQVWEGVAKAVLHQDMPPARTEARIREAVAGLLRDFARR